MKRLFLSAAVLAICGAATAVELPDVVGDFMVLQQRSNARLWGWSESGAEVTVVTSWDGRAYAATAAADGRWDVAVATPAASFDSHSITFSDAESTVTVSGVLVGEVWFCSGQSNMEMPLNGFWTQPIEGSNSEIAYSGLLRGRVRMATVEKKGALTPQRKASGAWKECVPENAQWFSACAYFFAKSLTRILDVPVGVINCSWGGSHVEGWLPEEALLRYPDVRVSDAGNEEVREWDRPMIMYNGLLHPLAGYTVKGFLWNQGESNINQHRNYPRRLADMVSLWRGLWGLGDLPFYCVEIPPHDYGDASAVNAALLREAQHAATRLIPNSGIVCTSDLSKPSEAADIHPSQKRQIGERLAFMAAARAYGIGGIACDSPTFRGMDIDGNTATLHFDNAPDGFTPNRDLKGFEAAGADRVFHPAEATEVYDTRDIQVRCDAVDSIVAVRYCFRNWMPGTVYNTRWLPLVPFRTDDW